MTNLISQMNFDHFCLELYFFALLEKLFLCRNHVHAARGVNKYLKINSLKSKSIYNKLYDYCILS